MQEYTNIQEYINILGMSKEMLEEAQNKISKIAMTINNQMN